MIVWNTFFNGDFQNFLYFFNFLSFAFLASILFFHDLSLTFTITTSLWWLRVHTWTKLDKFLNCTLTFAFGTFSYVLASFAIAVFTVSISFDLNFFHTTIVNFIESYFDFNELWLGFSGTSFSLSSSTKETENIAKSACSSRWTTTLNTFFSILIIKLPFLRIC